MPRASPSAMVSEMSATALVLRYVLVTDSTVSTWPSSLSLVWCWFWWLLQGGGRHRRLRNWLVLNVVGEGAEHFGLRPDVVADAGRGDDLGPRGEGGVADG